MTPSQAGDSGFSEFETMIFDQEGLEQLQSAYLAVFDKCQQLVTSYARRNYKNSRAEEYSKQGFSRRLKTLVRCIDNIFDIMPPDQIELPSNEELTDVAINLQAFITNVFGCTDNLAWIWVHESNLRKNDGSPIPKYSIGLRENNEVVRDSLSLEFQEYLRGLNDWFHNLENFRHALAHRIPLYVPPYIVPDDKMPAYRELEGRITNAFNRGDSDAHERWSAEQEALAVFNPFMTHSFKEEAKYVVFHPQILADFNTVEELGQKMLEELDR